MSANDLPLDESALRYLAGWKDGDPAWYRARLDLSKRWGDEFAAMGELAESVLTLRARVAELERELVEDDALRTRMGDILTLTVNALKGEPDSRSLHDWATLPEVARETVAHANALRDALACYECDTDASGMHSDNCLRCAALATTPAASLAALKAEMIERCLSAVRGVGLTRGWHEDRAGFDHGQEWMRQKAEDAIRALAAQEVK